MARRKKRLKRTRKKLQRKTTRRIKKKIRKSRTRRNVRSKTKRKRFQQVFGRKHVDEHGDIYVKKDGKYHQVTDIRKHLRMKHRTTLKEKIIDASLGLIVAFTLIVIASLIIWWYT